MGPATVASTYVICTASVAVCAAVGAGVAQQKNRKPSHVVGGFHLYNRSADQYENPSVIAEIGSSLMSTGAMFYTGHCTGIKAYEQLKSIMGDHVNYLSTGSQLII